MKKTVVNIGPYLTRPLEFKKSRSADANILKINLLLDVVSLCSKNFEKRIFSENGIAYLPLLYVEVLHEFVVRLYLKSEDPIVTGYMSKSNLNYALDQVKYMYSDTKNKKEKLIKKAAFIMYNIASKHPFTDGNKRTAIVASNSFLEYNGYSLWKLPFRKSKQFITDVATGTKKENDCQKFIKTHISKLVIPPETKKHIRKFEVRVTKKMKNRKD